VIDALSELLILCVEPSYVRSDNSPHFIAQAVLHAIKAAVVKTACILQDNPWENGHSENFNARFRDDLLNGEVFYSMREA
jgi:hypothetical protein